MEKLPSGAAPSIGDYIVVVGAGASGAPYVGAISNVVSSADVSTGVAGDPAVASADFYIGTPQTDGTVKWIDLDFDAVSGAACSHASLRLGRFGQTCKVI